MDTIKQYLESLFVNFPNTEEVRKAKRHLLEMAEDKYQNLLADGMSDNEAVAKVIAEFGNLDELKEELGLKEEVINEAMVDATPITTNDAKKMIHDFTISGFILGLGVCFFITCVTPPIFTKDSFGAAMMFVFIAIGVALTIIQHTFSGRWGFISNTPCRIDMQTAEYVKEEKQRYSATHTIAIAMGVLMIVLCFVPSILIHNRLGGAFLFWFVGIGVALIIVTNSRQSAYEKLLKVNPRETVGGTYSKGSRSVMYENQTVAAVMNVYWPLVTCVYISISFLTFAWGITWIIWPIAGVVHNLIKSTYGEEI